MSGRLFAVVLVPRSVAFDVDAVMRLFGTEWGQATGIHRGPATWNAPVEYQQEMCGPLTYVVVTFDRGITSSGLARMKRSALAIEQRTADGVARTLNINPGIATSHGVLVASHKPKPYRIRLSPDVWGQWVLAFTRSDLLPVAPVFTEYAGERELFAAVCMTGIEESRLRRLSDAA